MILRELPETNMPHNKISKNKNQKICMKCKITNILMELPETNIPKNRNSKIKPIKYKKSKKYRNK
jgi:hypothetical protein